MTKFPPSPADRKPTGVCATCWYAFDDHKLVTGAKPVCPKTRKK